jgi:hypothetical protein
MAYWDQCSGGREPTSERARAYGVRRLGRRDVRDLARSGPSKSAARERGSRTAPAQRGPRGPVARLARKARD